MVLINGIKYACERCIRGHRVTTCNHTDQPLMMIKPKGRPSTTCAYCKELKKNKSAKPSGTCTCGRQEKKRQAQRAKEEARLKAKELAAQNCTCSTDVICKVHNNRRQNRKSNKNNSAINSLHRKGKLNQSFERIASSTSLDSQFFSNQSVKSDSSAFLGSTFLDSDTNSGKISKDYHHVPSLASISSLQSSHSIDQNFVSPTNQPLTSMQFNFTENSMPTMPSSTNRAKFTMNGFEQEITNGQEKVDSNSGFMMNNVHISPNLESNRGIDLSNENNSINNRLSYPKDLVGQQKNSQISKFNIGEVAVPLEEYIPPNINGIGKINDVNSWSLEEHSNSPINPLAPKDSKESNSSSSKPGYSSINNNLTSNGLLDMFSDSSSISTLSRANLLLQEKSEKNTTALHSWNDKRDTVFSTKGNKSKYHCNKDNESVASVEVLSLMPSFMDIPEYDVSNRRDLESPSIIRSQNVTRRRSSSIDKDHKYYKSSPGRTINPAIVNNVDDSISLISYQAFDAQNNQTEPHHNEYFNSRPVTGNNNLVSPNDTSGCVRNNSTTINGNVALKNEKDNKYNPVSSNTDSNYDAENSNLLIDESKLSPTLTGQMTSPPTEFLFDKGFTELDNFLSSL